MSRLEYPTELDLPIVPASDVMLFLEQEGMSRWPFSPNDPLPIPFDDYRQRNLSDEERKILKRAPSMETVILVEPQCLQGKEGQEQQDKLFIGFRVDEGAWATTVVWTPGGHLLLVAEYKHGCDEVVIVPPSGGPKKSDVVEGDRLATYRNAARRELIEETGFIPRKLEQLASAPIPSSGRKSTGACWPFVGYLLHPDRPDDTVVERTDPKRDRSEQIVPFLMEPEEYFDFATAWSQYTELTAVTAVALALRHRRLTES